MTHSHSTVLLLLVAGAVVASCGSSTSAGTVTLELTVIAFDPDGPDVRVVGAEVCVVGDGECQTTDADGLAVLALPANAEVALTIEATGYTPALSPQTTKDVDLSGIQTALLTEETSALLAGALGTPYPLGDSGLMAISALNETPADDNGVAGVTYTLAGATPYYLDENSFPTYELTETTRPDGAGGFVELAAKPDGYDVTVGGTASNCTIGSAWPGSSPDLVRVPTLAGFFTQASIVCDPAPTP